MAKPTKTPAKRKARPTAQQGEKLAVQPDAGQSSPKGRVPSAFWLLKDTGRLLAHNWKVFGGITLVYGVFTILLVRGLGGGGSLGEAKASFDQLFTGNLGELASSMTAFAYLVGSSGNSSNPTGGVYQFMLALIMSLAVIWVLRQVFAGHKVRLRDGFYQGMSPLIPFLIVLLVVVLQLLPLAIASTAYSLVVSNGIAVTFFDRLLWGVPAFGLAVLSLYFVSSSLFALYIVTLPDMTPLAALRSAKQLVAKRRWMVMRKVLFLPLALLALVAALVIPIILLVTPVASWLFFALTMLLLPAVHAYMYRLYRALL